MKNLITIITIVGVSLVSAGCQWDSGGNDDNSFYSTKKIFPEREGVVIDAMMDIRQSDTQSDSITAPGRYVATNKTSDFGVIREVRVSSDRSEIRDFTFSYHFDDFGYLIAVDGIASEGICRRNVQDNLKIPASIFPLTYLGEPNSLGTFVCDNGVTINATWYTFALVSPGGDFHPQTPSITISFDFLQGEPGTSIATFEERFDVLRNGDLRGNLFSLKEGNISIMGSDIPPLKF